jgi:hypothetical protein
MHTQTADPGGLDVRTTKVPAKVPMKVPISSRPGLRLTALHFVPVALTPSLTLGCLHPTRVVSAPAMEGRRPPGGDRGAVSQVSGHGCRARRGSIDVGEHRLCIGVDDADPSEGRKQPRSMSGPMCGPMSASTAA